MKKGVSPKPSNNLKNIRHSDAKTVQGLDINPNNLWAQSVTAGEERGVFVEGGGVSRLDPMCVSCLICCSVLWSGEVHKEGGSERAEEVKRKLLCLPSFRFI